MELCGGLCVSLWHTVSFSRGLATNTWLWWGRKGSITFLYPLGTGVHPSCMSLPFTDQRHKLQTPGSPQSPAPFPTPSPTFVPPVLITVLWSRDLSGEPLASPFLITDWQDGLEKCVFLAVVKKEGDQGGGYVCENFLSSLSLLNCSRSLGLGAKFQNEREQGRELIGGLMQEKMVHTGYLNIGFGRGLQNSEMCLLFNVGKLTRNRCRSAMCVAAFDTGDGPLVGTSSPSAGTDWPYVSLCWKATFANDLLIPKLSSSVHFILIYLKADWGGEAAVARILQGWTGWRKRRMKRLVMTVPSSGMHHGPSGGSEPILMCPCKII